MASENENKLDYGAILADLEAKKNVLEQAIASLRAALVIGTLGSTEGSSYVNLSANVVSPSIHGGEVPAGAFFGKSIPEAAKLLLSIVKKKQSTKEICEALKEGGMETTSDNWEGIVAAGLNRAMKNTGAFLRVGKSWALPEWYPAGMRVVKDKRENRKPRKVKRKRTEPRESAPAPVPEPAPVPQIKTGHDLTATEGHHPAKLWERTVEFINSHPGQEFTTDQLSQQFGIHPKVISMTLAKPLKEGEIRMSAPRTYTAIATR